MAQIIPSTAPPDELLQQLNTALKHQKAGEMVLADKAYQKAMKEYPEFPDVTIMAAVFYIQIEKYKYAITILDRALKLKSADFTGNKLIGKAHYHEKNYKKAAEHLALANKLQSTDNETAGYLGLALNRLGQKDAAEIYLNQALPGTRDFNVVNALAEIYLYKKQNDKARPVLEAALEKGIYNYDTFIRLAIAIGEGHADVMPVLLQAIHKYPEHDQAKTMLAMNARLTGLPMYQTLSRDIQLDAIEKAINSPNANSRDLRLLWFSGFFRGPQSDAANKAVYNILNLKTYDAFSEQFSDPEKRRLFYSRFFTSGLKNCIVCAPRLERLFKFIRKYYLHVFSAQIHPLSEGDRNILEALSHQCFLTEYIFDLDDAETVQLQALKDQITSAAEQDGDALLIYSCYESLFTLANAVGIKNARKSLPGFLHSIIKIQIEDEIEQQGLRRSIPTLAAIKDETSALVREQYEENPYPRWQSTNFLAKEYRPVPAAKAKEYKTLIAGCGTGKHVIQAATINTKSEILAFDLSFSSLAYAKMKIQEYGIKNVRFMQGDILDLGSLDERFDAVESSGVIHHMKNPEDGLKALLSVLKDGGSLKLGLYSQLARQDVWAARRYIADNNMDASLQSIRAMRRHMMENEAEQYNYLLESYDFYSTSSCRDLIFHVQEKCYTLPEIKDMLERHNLEFSGFILPEIQINQFVRAHGDPANLDAWHEYEQKNPRQFAGMYQFTALKK